MLKLNEKKVLFVDDQEDILTLLKIKLLGEEYKKIFVNSTDEAIKVLNSEKIDVLVTDMYMPDKSGLTLLEYVNKMHKNIVKIVLSSVSQSNILLTAVNDFKVFKYITKPWRIDDAAKKIIIEAIEYKQMQDDFVNSLISIDNLKSILKFLDLKYKIIESVDDLTVEKDYATIHIKNDLYLKVENRRITL